jgi:uncharacterized protein (DUF1697 family)
MADLRDAIASADFEGVTTHIQTGNVIFSSRLRRSDAVAAAIEEALQTKLGLKSDAIMRTPRELAKVIGSNPFLERGEDAASLYVAFLKAKPSSAAAKAIADRSFGDDEFVLRGKEIYLRYPNGLGRSKMSAALFERALGTPATVRNWNVVTKLHELGSVR